MSKIPTEAEALAMIAAMNPAAAPHDVQEMIRQTVDLADQDHASGHLTTFWHQRVLALCEWLGSSSPVSQGAPTPALTVERLAALLKLLAHTAELPARTYEAEAAWLLPRLRPVGAPTPAEPVWCLAHRHTIPCPACGPTPAMIAAALREEQRHGGSFNVLPSGLVHLCACGEAFRDDVTRDGDDDWQWHVKACVLRAALTAPEEPTV